MSEKINQGEIATLFGDNIPIEAVASSCAHGGVAR
jgi:hypothetical protein